MNLRKLNTITSLILIAACFFHTTVRFVLSLKGIGFGEEIPGMTDITLMSFIADKSVSVCFFLHAFTGAVVYFFATPQKNLCYIKDNASTHMQRLSAVIVFVLVFMHYDFFADLGEMAMEAGSLVLFSVLNILFYAALFAHIAVSLPKAGISLGLLESGKVLDRVKKTVYVLCTLFFFLSVCGELVLFFEGGALL